MRLLHTEKLVLDEFFGSSIPLYAILSHRWESEEVTFQDFNSSRGPLMRGWSKIVGCCLQAREDGFKWVVGGF
jgi:hypothetical protein